MLRAGSRRVMTSTPKASAATSRLASVSRHMSSSAAAPAASGSSSAPAPQDEVRDISILELSFPSEPGPPLFQAPVLFESAYSSRTFILNRPKALNALDLEMIDILRPKIAVRSQIFY